MLIRPESPADHREIAAVVAAAFGSAVEADLVGRIRASPHYLPHYALVADDGGDIVGHVMVSEATARDGDVERSILSLSPLAVLPRRQRQGIGSALVREVVRKVEADGHPLVARVAASRGEGCGHVVPARSTPCGAMPVAG